MTLTTRKPTGLPSWPMILLAGREGAGKTWAAISASASPLIGRTLYIGVGEDDPDEYALIPGADFEIVEHDGTYGDIVRAVRDAVAAEPVGGLPTLIILDSETKVWELIVDNAQLVANQRRKGRPNPNGDFSINTDLWNVAADQFKDITNVLRSHRGPSIVTARLDEVMVMENGQPTSAKRWKVQAHKSLPFDVGVIVEMHERGHALITKAKSVVMAIEKPTEAPGFTIPEAWDKLGITAKSEMSERQHAGTVTDDPSPEAVIARWRARAENAEGVQALRDLYQEARRLEVDQDVLDVISSVAARRTEEGSQLPVDPGTTEPRAWVDEATAKEFSDEVAALLAEAKAVKAHSRVLSKLAEIQAGKPDRPSSEPAAGWAATADVVSPVEGAEAGE
jgi:hypothetical protein